LTGKAPKAPTTKFIKPKGVSKLRTSVLGGRGRKKAPFVSRVKELGTSQQKFIASQAKAPKAPFKSAIKPSQPTAPKPKVGAPFTSPPSQPPTKKIRVPPPFSDEEKPLKALPLIPTGPDKPSQPPPRPVEFKVPVPPPFKPRALRMPTLPKKPVPPRFLHFGARVRPIGASIREEPGWNTFVKQRGKFIKANVVPIKRRQARDLGTFVIDRSLSATFKIKPAKSPAQNPRTVIPNRYFDRNIQKLRPYKIKKGQKILTVDQFIEKRRFRLDTSREVQKIQAAKVIASLRKPFGKRR